ncbi:MAG TPA: hypothetical protein VGI19_07925 [Candidatus Cybelea sp.]|jgi:hypothetical protein
MYAIGSSKPLHSTQLNYYVLQAHIALDSRGDLCESNGNVTAPLIYAYDARTLVQKGAVDSSAGYAGLVADRFGYLYGSNGAFIWSYAPGCTRQVDVIRRCQSSGPLVFDTLGNLYAGEGRAICVFAPTRKPGHMRFARAIEEGLHGAAALAIGPSNELFVANFSNSSVTVYQLGGSKPIRTVTKGLADPDALAVDSRGWLYVANVPNSPPSVSGWVSIYAPGGTRPIRYIKYKSRVAPSALAIDSSDNLYVAAYNTVRVYSPGAVKLLRRITKGVAAPMALLVGSP